MDLDWTSAFDLWATANMARDASERLRRTNYWWNEHRRCVSNAKPHGVGNMLYWRGQYVHEANSTTDTNV